MRFTRLSCLFSLAALSTASVLLGAAGGDAPVLTTSTGDGAPVLTFSTGGGPPGADIFAVELSPAGHLKVIHRALPMTARGMTESTFELDLDGERASRLVDLAFAADDFDQGCGKQIADGMNAHLEVRQTDRTVRRDCIGASQWPLGPKTQELLTKLNGELPKEFQVF